MIKVLLVDDHPHIRRVLREILETYPDVSVIAEAENGEEAVAQAATLEPSVVILDIHLPKMDGIQATTLIKLRNQSVAVIGLTAGEPCHEDTEMVLAAGAADLINKAEVINLLYPSILEAVRRLQNPLQHR